MLNLIPWRFSSIKWAGRSTEDPEAFYLSIYFSKDRAVEIIVNNKYKDIILRDIQKPQNYVNYNYIRQRSSTYKEYTTSFSEEKEALAWIFKHIEDIENNPCKLNIPLRNESAIVEAIRQIIPKVDEYLEKGSKETLIKECQNFKKLLGDLIVSNNYSYYNINTSKSHLYGVLDYIYKECPSLYHYMMTVLRGKDSVNRAFGYYVKSLCTS